MFRQRVITAALLVPPVVIGLLWMPTSAVALCAGIVAALGAWEWAALTGWLTARERGLYVLFTVLVMSALYLILYGKGIGPALCIIAVAWWCVALVGVVIYQSRGRQLLDSALVRRLAGLVIVIPAWGAVVLLHRSPDGGPYWVLFLLSLVWAADSAAYIVGRRFGKHRMADRVSPGKTWEGFFGALCGISLAALGGAAMLLPEHMVVLPFILLCLITGVVSILGDLVESQYKRLAGVKDSGTLLPGHGGVLDRIDSLTAAAPVFVLGVMVLGIRL